MKLKISWRGGCGHSAIRRGSDYIKQEYLGQTFQFDENDRTKIVRFFQEIFVERHYTSGEIHAITCFLKRKFLTRSEIYAVAIHLGHRYSSRPNANNLNLRIDGYLDNRRK